MFAPFWISVAIAAVFYLLIPITGAFLARRDWRRFRAAVISLSLEPVVRYLRSGGESSTGVGRFRMLGRLDASGPDARIWIRGDSVTVSVDLADADVFSLPGEGDTSDAEGDALFRQPERLSPRKAASLPLDTKAWIGGAIRPGNAGPELIPDPSGRPLVVFFEGAENDLFRRCLKSGRQRNEYWNSLTPISITVGVTCMVALLVGMTATAVIPTVWILTVIVAMIPVLPFLPPGILGTWVYRRSWNCSCLLRSDRDIFKSPLRYFRHSAGREALLPDGSRYCRTTIRASEIGERVSPGFTVTRMSCGEAPSREDERLTVFGSVAADGRLVSPSDFMAELIAFPGDPEELSRLSSRKARVNEILAAVSITLGCLANAVWIWFALRAVL